MNWQTCHRVGIKFQANQTKIREKISLQFHSEALDETNSPINQYPSVIYNKFKKTHKKSDIN